jgi:hypothetical protein
LTKFEVLNPKTLGQEHLNQQFKYEEIDDMGRRIIKAGDAEYRVRCTHKSGLWEIFQPEGGALPQELKGWFTNIRACEDALAAYASRKSREGVQAREYRAKLEEQGFFDRPVEPSEEPVEPIKYKKPKAKKD